jgi:hypothetical protein
LTDYSRALQRSHDQFPLGTDSPLLLDDEPKKAVEQPSALDHAVTAGRRDASRSGER